MAGENWNEMFYFFWKTKGNAFIQFLLDAGLDVNSLTKYGKTMLTYAAEWGNLEIIEFLVQVGADGNVTNSDGSKPLHIASRYCRKDIVKFFLDREISADSCDNDNCTPLHYLAQSHNPSADIESHQEIAYLLVNCNCDLNAVNRKGRTPLLHAARISRKHFVELLIQLGANVNFCDEDQWTILHHSSWNGWADIVKSLVEDKLDIDLNARTSMGHTPLLLAARQLCKDIVELLIKLGANVDFYDENQWTILHYSSWNRWLDVVKYLVSVECDINAKDDMGWTPLLLAADRHHRSVVEFLIESGADTECSDKDGWKVLHYACQLDWSDVVKSLIKKGSNLNAQTFKCHTPLHIAVGARNTEIIEQLLKAGADWNLENDSGETALNKCIRSHLFNLEDVIVFIENGAYFQSRDCSIIMVTPLLKEGILKDVRLCTQTIINRFYNADLNKIYKILAERLPPIENMKIDIHRNVSQGIAENVNFEIQTKGYCDLLNACPIFLSRFCLKSLVEYYNIWIN